MKKEMETNMTRNLLHFDPFAGFEALRRELFDDSLLRGKLPTVDVYTNDDKALVVEAHLPNFDEKDVDISVDKGTLVIQAERQEKDQDKTKRYLVRESSSSFYRSISLPDQADEQHIKADFDNGILRVSVPLKEIASPTKIAIGSSRHDG